MSQRLIEILIILVVVFTVGTFLSAVIAHNQEVHNICTPKCAPHPVSHMRGDVCACDMRVEYR